jgi:hypothetical protein
VGAAINEFRDKSGLNFLALSEPQKKALTEYTNWATSVFTDLNKTLNELSGAAVNEHEMKRLVKQLPTQDDGPTTFLAKARTVQGAIRMSIARLNYFRSKGLPADFEKMSLESFKKDIFNKRGSEIAQEVRKANPSMDERTLRIEVYKRVHKEFGVDA